MDKIKRSKTTNKVLLELEQDLRLIMEEVLNRSTLIIGLSTGYRTPEEQLICFNKGLSACDGYKILSNHNYKPSRAVDTYVNDKGKTSYKKEDMKYITDLAKEVTKELLAKKIITHNIRCGIDWRKQDSPHIELLWN